MEHLHLYFSCTTRLHYFLVNAPIETLVTLISRSCLKSSTVVSVLGSATSLSKSFLLAYTLPVLLCLIISFAVAGIFGKSVIAFYNTFKFICLAFSLAFITLSSFLSLLIFV